MAKQEPIPMSAAGRAALEAELKELVQEKRPVVVKRMATAREEGDLKENFGYHDARHELGLLDGRVQTIEATLRLAVVVEDKGSDGSAAMGREVVVRDAFGDSTYKLVGPAEADVATGLISISSPLGSALVGAREGDEVTFQAPNGEQKITVVSIK